MQAAALASRGPHRPAPWTMPLFPLRPRLDDMVRRWRRLSPSAEADAAWGEIEREAAERTRRAARRNGLPADEIEDLEQEVKLALLLRLRASAEVENCDAYLKAVINNGARLRTRRERPVWNALRDEIVDTLRGKRGAAGFKLWRCGSRDLAGFASWEARPFEGSDRYFEVAVDDRPLRRAVATRGHPEQMPLPLLLKAIFDWLRTPVPVNELTELVFTLRGRPERSRSPLEPGESTAAPVEGPERAALRKDTVARIGQGVLELPRERIAAFLFHLAPEVAERLLLGISPGDGGRSALQALAARLGLPAPRLEETLETEIPWADLRIAEFLEIRRGKPSDDPKKAAHDTQMVIVHLRRGAVQAIQRRLADGPEPGRS